MNVSCPHCQVWLAIDPSQSGTIVACHQCGGKFRVTVPTGAPATPSPMPMPMPMQPHYSQHPDIQSFASKKIAAGICGILLGGLGIHKFILGFNSAGVVMLVVSLLGVVTGVCLIVPVLAATAMSIIGLVEGIIYLTKTDQEFYHTYAIQRRDWF